MGSQYSTVIIVGAGPAGVACATQLKRHNIDSIIFEKDEIGGLLRNANLIENYPGFPAGITGANFVRLFKKHAQTYDLNIIYENVESVSFSNDNFQINADTFDYSCKYLVVASGTKPIIPEIPIIIDDVKDKIFFDIHNLGEISGKNIAIIGAGDCAFDYALKLNTENQVIILNRNDRIKALELLQQRVFSTENISYIDNILINNIIKVGKKIELQSENNDKSFKVDYLLIAVGRKPNLDFIDEEVLTKPHLFQIGDVRNGIFRQTSIAVGDGTFTAMKINNIIK